MESLIAFLVLATLICRFTSRSVAGYSLFAVSLVLLVILLRLHTTDALHLDF
jgi:hypothetical protein